MQKELRTPPMGHEPLKWPESPGTPHSGLELSTFTRPESAQSLPARVMESPVSRDSDAKLLVHSSLPSHLPTNAETACPLSEREVITVSEGLPALFGKTAGATKNKQFLHIPDVGLIPAQMTISLK